jgi:hypothetical protein
VQPQAADSAPAAQCAHCGSPLAAGQDWCLHCGAGAPGSLAATAQSWRSGWLAIAAVVLLLAGAGAAAYAAWGKHSHAARSPLLARSAVPPALGGTGLAGTPGSRALPGAATGTTPGLGALAKPPKIPLKAVTPKTAVPPQTTSTPSAASETHATNTTTTPASTGGSTAKEAPALELDTNAASTYDPYSYPAANFGDPSLAIDGDTSTAWTAQVEPSVAPKMAEGLAIDLRTGHSIASVKLHTSTPDMTVQVYGANGHALPTSITEGAWVPLSHALVVKKNSTTIKLRDTTRAFRFIVLWISRAPESAVGTPTAPGHVRVNELELFPPTK